MKKSIGIDVSCKNLDVFIKYGSKRNVINQFPNTQNSAKKIARLGDENTIFTMEATGIYHLTLAKALYEAGCKVSVVNPIKIKRYAEMKMLRAKTDKIDARIIAEYGYTMEPDLFKPRTELEEQIRSMSKMIESLIKMQTKLKNQRHSLKKNPYKVDYSIRAIENTLKTIKEEIKKLEKEIDKKIREGFAEENEKVDPVFGVGKRIKSIIFGHLRGFKDFENVKQVSAYVGLNPSIKQSGSSVRGKGNISKKGNKYIRSMFYMATVSAIVRNPQCKKYYNRLIAKGKLPMVAMTATANKLLKIVFAIVKYKRDYDPNYC